MKRRKQIASAIKATYQVLALEAYREELARKDLGLHHKGVLLLSFAMQLYLYPQGVKTICREFVQRCKRETKHVRVVLLSHTPDANFDLH